MSTSAPPPAPLAVRAGSADAQPIRLASRTGRWVLATTVLGSGMAFLDGTVVTVALPTIGRDLGAGIADLQWTVTAYTLTLSAFLLMGGSLGDRYGRRRLFVVGVAWFTVASAVCALAPGAIVLVAARAAQGIGGALLTPVSLAIIEASFRKEDRPAAVGAWAGLGGIFGAAGPLVGGALVAVSWRLVFLINVPVAAVAIAVAERHVPETRSSRAAGRLDVPGPLLAALALGALTFALIQGAVDGWGSPPIAGCFAGGVVLSPSSRSTSCGSPTRCCRSASSVRASSAARTARPSSSMQRSAPSRSCWSCTCSRSAATRPSPRAQRSSP